MGEAEDTHLQTDYHRTVLQRVTTPTHKHTHASHNEESACTDLPDKENHVGHINNNDIPLQCKYLLTALKSNAYPTVVLILAGKDVTFLVDFGSTNSTLVCLYPRLIQNMPELCAQMAFFLTEPYFSPLKGHWIIGDKCVTSHHKFVVGSLSQG